MVLAGKLLRGLKIDAKRPSQSISRRAFVEGVGTERETMGKESLRGRAKDGGSRRKKNS